MFYLCYLLKEIFLTAFSALTLLVGRQEEHLVCKNWVMRGWCVICLKKGADCLHYCMWSDWCHQCRRLINFFLTCHCVNRDLKLSRSVYGVGYCGSRVLVAHAVFSCQSTILHRPHLREKDMRKYQFMLITQLYFTTKCDSKKNRIETGLN